MNAVVRTLCLALVSLLAAASVAAAQDNYEIQVYGAPTIEPRSTMFELHSNFTFDGRKNFLDGMYPTEHAEHETLEITQGINDWAEVGFYVFTSARNGQGLQWVGDHIRPRIRVPDSWGWPVGVSLSTEFGYQRTEFSEDSWNWEIRPIIDQQIGAWYWAVNPAFERTWKGPGVTEGVGFAPSAKVAYTVTPEVSGGFEYYGSYGSVNGFAPMRDQQHQFFGAVDLNVSPVWEINFGVGVGTTPATDHLIAKLILGRHVFWGRQDGRR
ncbi:MAG TPA: hypothetical protein VMV51_14865 [Gemmatimonadaceae bacterium]|nr:hypothetical protein [Gemmatimonadaceae bacterium]